jgi:hypothetical protein
MKQQAEILDYFQILKKHSSLGTSYAFVGQNQSLVFEIVKYLSCQAGAEFCGNCWDCKRIGQKNHPDLLVIEPDGLTIKIEKIREAIQFLSLKAFRLENKFLVIKDAQNLTHEAANAFLKTLEEPPKNSFIALCTSKQEGLLPTIISRCRKIFLPFEVKDKDPEERESISDFLRGQEIRFKDRKAFTSFLWNFIVLLRAQLLFKVGYQNNQLPQNHECEIILGRKDLGQIQGLLRETIKIYTASGNVNMNLALNLIRMRMDQK